MQPVPLAAYPLLRPLYAVLSHHLAVAAALSGAVPGQVWADDPAQPAAGLLWVSHRLYLGGFPPGGDSLGRLLAETVCPPVQAGSQRGLAVTWTGSGWADALAASLPAGWRLLPVRQQTYECMAAACPRQAALPSGYALRPVDAALLDTSGASPATGSGAGSGAGSGLIGLDALRAEMCSERPSVSDFVAHSFGVCTLAEGPSAGSAGDAATGSEIAGWCLSEYNHGDACEVGIETREPYRRQGLGTALTLALVEMARQRGIRRIGWHCFARNLASAATARKAGFTLVEDTIAGLLVFDA